MRNKLLFIIILICKMLAMEGFGQNLQNGDLDGIVTIGSDLPHGWLNVPFSDINCIATQDGWDSPDLTNLNGPNSLSGINGNPYSGLTFVSGMYGGNPANFWQEGIMQNVSGFLIGQSYSIRFYQTVVRNVNALDKSGSWGGFIDTNLAKITIPSYSNEFPGTSSLPWEARDFIFTANAPSHLIKFLPIDDDSNFVFSTTDTTGALRMGIDSISLSLVTGIEEQEQDLIISIYPNPAQHQLNISLEKPFSGRLSISNLLGQEVYILPNTNARSKFNLDVGSLPAGVYVLSFENDKGVVRKKFVKE